MRAPIFYESLCTTAAYAIAAIGALLLYLSLFGDRSRGRRRCSKCWYDMSAASGLTCPECGREHAAERQLFRTRRRPRRALLSLAVLGAGLGTAAIPSYGAFGQLATCPTWALVAIQEWRGWPTPTNYPQRTAAEELEDRCRRGQLGWLSRFVMRRMARYWTFQYRRQWAADTPIAIQPLATWWYLDGRPNCVLQARLLNGAHGVADWVTLTPNALRSFTARIDASLEPSDGFAKLGLVAADANSLQVELRVVHMRNWGQDEPLDSTWDDTLSFPLHLSPTPLDVLTPIRNREIDMDIAASALMAAPSAPIAVRPPLLDAQGAQTTVFALAASPAAAAAGLTTAARVDFVRNGHVFASGRVWHSAHEPPHPISSINDVVRQELSMDFGGDGLHLLEPADLSWSLRITADPALALRDFGSTRCWVGSIEIPASQVHRLTEDPKP